MEHTEALERIEIAAVEPDGLDRLMAGDTADSAAVAGHLAGCAACTAELARIRRTSAIAREVIRTQPDPALRARTLDFVRAAGVPRGPAAGVPAPASPGAPETSAPAPAVPVDIAVARDRRALRRLRIAVVALAAGLVIAVGTGVYAYRSVSETPQASIQAKNNQIAALEETARATLRVTAQPDARRVELAPVPAGGTATGTLVFSPSSGELVAVASALAPEQPGQAYRCWVEAGGTRRQLGTMYWAGSVWTWAGPVAGLGDIPPGATFGVSLVSAADGVESQPALVGAL